MRKLFSVLLGLALMEGAQAAPPPTPDAVLAQLKAQGLASVRAQYFSCRGSERGTGKGYDLIRTGDAGWLRVAAVMAKDMNEGCYAIALQSAIAMAALKKPAGVLKLVDSQPSLAAGNICMPFMTDEFKPARIREQLALLGRLEAAMNTVTSPALRRQRAQCLSLIHAAQADSRAQLKRVTVPQGEAAPQPD